MITMENTRELIDFEYYGKSYRMAPDEIEAAYRYNLCHTPMAEKWNQPEHANMDVLT